MNYCHNSLFIGFPLSSFFKKIISKYFIHSYNRDSHEVEHSSKASISSFRYSSFSSKLSGLIERWVNSSISNELFRGRESFYIPDFCNKMGGGYIFKSFDRFKDFKLFRIGDFTLREEKRFNFFKFFLQREESSDFTFKDFFMDRRCYSNRVSCSFKNFRDRARSFSSSFCLVENLEDFLLCGIKESIFRGKREEEMERREGEWVYEREEFREEDVDESFNFVFQRCYFLCDSFSFSCKNSKFRERGFLLGESFCMNSQEFSNDRGISFISFSFSQRDSGEIRDDEGIKEHTMEVMGTKEREEIYVIRARGFHSDEELRGRKTFRFNRVDERFKAFTAHRELRREKYFSLPINQGSIKKVFRDIDTTEKREHDGTSFLRFYEAGEASHFILHSDKGSKTQVKWSSPASLLLSYQAYKFININYS